MTTHHTSLYNSDTTPAPRKVLKQELVTWEETRSGIRIARLKRTFGDETHRDSFNSEHVRLTASETQQPVEQGLDIPMQVGANWQPSANNPAKRASMEELNSIAKGGYLGRDTPYGVKCEGKGENDG